MNLEEYEFWIKRIITLMRMDNESEKFIMYCVDWFNCMKGKTEVSLVSQYHPDFKDKSDSEILDFIHKARFVIDGCEDYEFKRQIFDSAFFLYRPLLKEKFKVDSKRDDFEKYFDYEPSYYFKPEEVVGH